MRKIKKLDELQLLKRGNIFKHGMFCLIGLLLLNTLLYSQGIEWASGKWAELTIILFTIVLCSIEFILYDIYPLTENKQKHLIYFLGLFGFVALIACIYDLIVGKSGIVVDGKITETALGIIYGFFGIARAKGHFHIHLSSLNAA
ncbi:MAG TPA: hypothetical protein IAB79_04970 [Candidatus Faecousia excrementipullorum]|nr:hypothetical protein [Candidatus Faecousia excrementipullorum]